MVTIVLLCSSFLVVNMLQNKRAQASFATHADELRSRAAAAPIGSEERASLEAEIADVASAAQDWKTIAHDESILAAPISYDDGEPKLHNTIYVRGGAAHKGPPRFTKEQKMAASDERTALLSKHSEHAFDSTREEMSHCRFFRDGYWIPVVIALVGFPLAAFRANTPCASPIAGVLCLHQSAATYTCTVDPTGASCISTPISV
jgi:hypothetical protein